MHQLEPLQYFKNAYSGIVTLQGASLKAKPLRTARLGAVPNAPCRTLRRPSSDAVFLRSRDTREGGIGHHCLIKHMLKVLWHRIWSYHQLYIITLYKGQVHTHGD